MLTVVVVSIRAKVRDEMDGYSILENYWLRCLYQDEEGDPEDVEKGFLKSGLLVKVRIPSLPPLLDSGSLIACRIDVPDDFYFAIIRTREFGYRSRRT